VGAYILRRLLISIPVLLGITLLGFVALKLSPGDPLLTSINPEVLANLAANPELLEAERRRLGFDQPIFPNQYVRWLGNALQGDLGYSITSKRLIVDEIGSRLPQTLYLMITALSLAILIGIPIDPHGRPNGHPGCHPPPDPARDRARDRQCRADRALYPGEHARRAPQRIRDDRALQGPAEPRRDRPPCPP
jgi:ABC-type microcin C transport system permease subunit YejB